jgi:hypothetical protein
VRSKTFRPLAKRAGETLLTFNPKAEISPTHQLAKAAANGLWIKDRKTKMPRPVDRGIRVNEE